MKDEFPLTLEADIYLLGSGVLSFLDITLLTQKILKQCAVVYHLVDLHSVERYLSQLTKNTVGLNPLYYVDGRDRRDIYRDIVRHVIDGALKERPVALLLHGHPLVYCGVSQDVYQEAERKGLRVEAVPAVSSLDRIFTALRLDIGFNGIQIYEASSLMLRRLPLSAKADCLLFQIGALMNPLASKKQSPKPEDMLPLKDYLMRWYPAGHRIKIVEIAVELGFESQILDIAIEELEAMAPEIRYNSSLYIPAVSTAP